MKQRSWMLAALIPVACGGIEPARAPEPESAGADRDDASHDETDPNAASTSEPPGPSDAAESGREQDEQAPRGAEPVEAPSSGDSMVSGEDELSDTLDMLARYESDFANALSKGVSGCREARTLRSKVCSLAERICSIAEDLPRTSMANARCDDGRRRCEDARKRYASHCE